jgi:hypothetical protein
LLVAVQVVDALQQRQQQAAGLLWLLDAALLMTRTTCDIADHLHGKI